MPSPFPGMDPYLELPQLWPDVHHEMISVIRVALNRAIRQRFMTLIKERVYLVTEDDPVRRLLVPNLQFQRSTPPPVDSEMRPPSPVMMTTLEVDDVAERYIEVFETATKKRVTVLEILRPANKLLGSASRANYLRKRHEIVSSETHWVEVDLLRAGTVTFPRPKRPHEYAVHASRHGQRPRGMVWTMRLDEPLPTIRVPLKGLDDDAPLDLQACLTTAYENAAYQASVDYRAEPTPPLTPEQAAWADALLRERGLRP